MSLLNVTFDDFDPVLVYSNPADWTTPDPQVSSLIDLTPLEFIKLYV
jgi:hypothetical protein